MWGKPASLRLVVPIVILAGLLLSACGFNRDAGREAQYETTANDLIAEYQADQSSTQKKYWDPAFEDGLADYTEGWIRIEGTIQSIQQLAPSYDCVPPRCFSNDQNLVIGSLAGGAVHCGIRGQDSRLVRDGLVGIGDDVRVLGSVPIAYELRGALIVRFRECDLDSRLQPRGWKRISGDR